MTFDPRQAELATATRADLDWMLDWAAAEGWNPGVDDADPFFAADPQGFFVARVGGTPAASMALVRYSEAFAFIGFYITAPDWRGHGLGRRLWDHALASHGARTIGLDALPDMVPRYAAAGFTPAHRTVTMAGFPYVEPPRDPRLTIAGRGLFPSLSDYDGMCFPAPRAPFLSRWLEPGGSRRAFALVDAGRVSGFGAIRQCRDGFKIGPLFADTPVDAEVLLRALVSQVRGQEVFLKVPEHNGEAMRLAEECDLSPMLEATRMFRGPAPEGPSHRVFGLTTLDLG
ncbi:N-acetyltransferase GCN5 [Stappia taiwanensis]|nr:GNAT family N-acetyltransferase [Stappia taiwanensis]GGE94186.1 N-acetyltransferase GCN5 [Stappia taiwanensis]